VVGCCERQPFYHGRQSGKTLGSPDRRAKESPPKLAGKGILTKYKVETIMNQIIQFGKQKQPLMSSREIAQLCEKRHDNVLRDIERLNATYAEMGLLKIEVSKYINQLNGVEYPEYLLTREQCIDLITGYRADVRIRINRRWMELEEQAAPSVPQTLPEALRLAADLAERNEQQAALLAETRPKAQALERISHADGDLCITDAAKLLKLRPKDLFGLLSMRRWIYKRDGRGSWIGYQDKVQQGLIRHSEHRYTDSSGTEQLRAQVYLTPKGITRLAQMVETEAGHA